MSILSPTKMEYIENWRKEVWKHIKDGTICTVVIEKVVPDLESPAVKNFNFHVDAAAHARAIPVVKLQYHHGDASHRHRITVVPPINNFGATNTTNEDKPDVKNIGNHGNVGTNATKVGPTPTVIVDPHLGQNGYSGLDDHTGKVDRNVRNSARTAREIYARYNNAKTSEQQRSREALQQDSQRNLRSRSLLSLPLKFQGFELNVPVVRNSNKTIVSRQRSSLTSQSQESMSRRTRVTGTSHFLLDAQLWA